MADPAGIIPKLYNADIEALLRTVRYFLNWPLKIHFIPRGLPLEVAAIKFSSASLPDLENPVGVRHYMAAGVKDTKNRRSELPRKDVGPLPDRACGTDGVVDGEAI